MVNHNAIACEFTARTALELILKKLTKLKPNLEVPPTVFDISCSFAEQKLE